MFYNVSLFHSYHQAASRLCWAEYECSIEIHVVALCGQGKCEALYKPRGEMLYHYHLTGIPLPALISHLFLYIALRAHLTGLKYPSVFPLALAPSLTAMLAGARLVCKLQGCCPCVVLPVSVCMLSVYVNPSHSGPEPVRRHGPRLLQANRILLGLCQAFHSGLVVVWAW